MTAEGEGGFFALPLCDECGQRAEMMLSVSNLIEQSLTLEKVRDELCAECSEVLCRLLAEQGSV